MKKLVKVSREEACILYEAGADVRTSGYGEWRAGDCGFLRVRFNPTFPSFDHYYVIVNSDE